MFSPCRQQFTYIWNNLGCLWLLAMSMVLISCWMYGSELLGAAAVSSGRPFIGIPRSYYRMIEHQLDILTKADHAGEVPRPSSDSNDFCTWCILDLKPKTFLNPSEVRVSQC